MSKTAQEKAWIVLVGGRDTSRPYLFIAIFIFAVVIIILNSSSLILNSKK